MLELGDLARDKVTGFTGIVFGKSVWISGCDIMGIVPHNQKGDTWIEGRWFDITRLELIEKNKVNIEKEQIQRETGGPQSVPQQANII